MFETKKTNETKFIKDKTLVMGHHGWGKTHQCRHYQEAYGKGLILSGEGGLKSLEDTDIEYVDFKTWDGDHRPEDGVYSFRGITRMMSTPEFKKLGYNWLAVDSLTELSDQLMEHIDVEFKDVTNGFVKWGEYSRLMIGALKWLRDVDMHIYMTCLVSEEADDNGNVNYWPLVKGNKIAKQLPALFDHVFCGVRVTDGDKTAPTIKRLVITEEVRGWHGKSRDPRGRLKPVEQCDNVITLLKLIRSDEASYEKYRKAQTKRKPTEVKKSTTEKAA
ncbi:MAG TPA: AAA family ATPase [Arenicellales bacterium]|jgi:hypothetical protein|nr:AAA family ATPase [Arenicellales bacterium]|tara:strand:+ start:3119 stop:3943 length:825 start_codon:yes stop_codon:yes gene_type:complete